MFGSQFNISLTIQHTLCTRVSEKIPHYLWSHECYSAGMWPQTAESLWVYIYCWQPLRKVTGTHAMIDCPRMQGLNFLLALSFMASKLLAGDMNWPANRHAGNLYQIDGRLILNHISTLPVKSSHLISFEAEQISLKINHEYHYQPLFLCRNTST